MSNYVNDMTNEEIWEMLCPKMKKNGLSAYMFSIPTLENIEGDIKWVKEQTYKANDVYNAVALAYRSGYERAMKGRPFKFDEKKVGHWEPVDLNNLPRYGTKVKYSRYNGMYKKDFGREGEFIAYGKYGNGMAFSTPESCLNWMCFDKIEDCLDMWVEDDE